MGTHMKTKMLYIKSIAPHFHENEFEIIVVLKGTICIHKLERQELVSEGQFVMVNRNITHWIESQGACVLCSKIDLRYFKHIYDKIEFVEFYYMKENTDDDIKQRINGIIMDCVVKNFIYLNYDLDKKENTFNENQLISTLYSFYRLNSFRKNDDEYVSDELLDRYFYVIKYVNEHINEKISVDDILKHVYMNSTYFSQFMKKVGGWGFKELVSYVKFTKVVQHLISEKLTMSEIAAEVGITDMKSFYNSFKRYFHMSPTKWKKINSQYQDNYMICFDDKILHDFLHKYNIVNHQENTITKVYKKLLEYQIKKANLKGTKMIVNPYEDMEPFNQKHYQVYKNIVLFFQKAEELGIKVEFSIPIHCLKNKEHENLLYNLLIENTKIYTSSELKKWNIILVANSKVDIEKARKILNHIMNISKSIPVSILVE